MTRSVSISTVLAVFILTALGAGHDVHAAKRKKHHKGHAPSGGSKASAPEPAEETESGGESEAGAAPEHAASKPAPEPEAAPPPEEESGSAKPKKKKIKMEGEAASEPAAASGLPWLDLSLGVSVLSRALSFHQDVDPQGSQLSPYSLPAWPVGLVSAVLYLEPLASALGNLGIEGHAMQGFGVSSRFSSSSTSFASTVHDYSGGARYRFPFGAGNAMFVSARFGEDAFTFNGPGTTRSTLLTPDTIYHYVRGGVGLQLAVTPSMSLSAGAGYRYIVNKGGPQISEQFFPHLTVAGADAQVGLTYALSDIYALRAGVDWRRYWYDFHTVRGDNFLVGGAVDQSFLFSVSLVLTIGGSSGEHAEAEEAPAKKPDKAAKSKGDTTDKTDEGGESGGGSDEGNSGSKPSGGDDL